MKFPNSGAIFGYATELVRAAAWVEQALGDLVYGDQAMFVHYLLNVLDGTEWTLDYCSEVVLNWHQLRRDRVPQHLPALWHHFNGPDKQIAYAVLRERPELATFKLQGQSQLI